MSGPDVFISLRYAETQQEAEQLQARLGEHGVSAYINRSGSGDNVAREVLTNLRNCKLPVLMGSKTYGTPTASPCSTEIELRAILEMQSAEQKQFFLIQMCKQYEDPIAFAHLTPAIGYVKWMPGSPMPDKLVSQILAHKQLQNANSLSLGAAVHGSGGSGSQQKEKVKNKDGKEEEELKSKQEKEEEEEAETGELRGEYTIQGTTGGLFFVGNPLDEYENHFVLAEASGIIDRERFAIVVEPAPEQGTYKLRSHVGTGGYWFVGNPTDAYGNHFVLAQGAASAKIDERRLLFTVERNDQGYTLRGADYGCVFVGNPKDSYGNHYVLAEGGGKPIAEGRKRLSIQRFC